MISPRTRMVQYLRRHNIYYSVHHNIFNAATMTQKPFSHSSIAFAVDAMEAGSRCATAKLQHTAQLHSGFR